MSDKEYHFADLQPEVVDEIQVAEKRLSEQSGQPIILIAYRSDAVQPGDDHERDSTS